METGPRLIGCLVGNININGRNGPSTSLTLRSGRTAGRPSVLSVRRNAPEVEGRSGQTERRGALWVGGPESCN